MADWASLLTQFSSVQFSCSVMSNPSWPHGLQHTRPPCPSPPPGVYSNSRALSQWCHPTISSSVIPYSSHPQSFPASGSLQMSQFFASGNQSIGVWASTSVSPMNTQDWFPLGLTDWISLQSSSVQFSCSVVSDSFRPHELQHARPPCPSPTPGVHSDSRPSSQWYHPAISSSVFPFSSCPQSLPASESFPMSQLFAWGGQSTGVSALASFLPKKSQGWSPSEWTGWISLQSKGLSRVFSNTTREDPKYFLLGYFTSSVKFFSYNFCVICVCVCVCVCVYGYSWASQMG